MSETVIFPCSLQGRIQPSQPQQRFSLEIEAVWALSGFDLDALTFTPLFTASLGSLPAKLYSHGSALLGTVQQLAGAIGAALFVALMSRASAAMLAGGMPAIAATAGGIRVAFLCGAMLSIFAVVAACFVRKPAVIETADKR